MADIEQYLKTLHAGRILDVATGSGNFIHTLLDMFGSYDEIIGIDTSKNSATAFAQAFVGKPVRFMQMDAARMDFTDASFDTVSIAYSLHHMPDLQGTLSEMKRVLRPGGHFIISEMYRDDQTEAQMTHVLMHHWWAAVDTARGISHNETCTRQQILDIVAGLQLDDLRLEDRKELASDPRDPETVKYLVGVVDQYLERIQELPGEAALRTRGGELRRRVQEIGFHSATSLLIFGRNPAPASAC
jgi:SAM-dependent methyltransferase